MFESCRAHFFVPAGLAAAGWVSGGRHLPIGQQLMLVGTLLGTW